ncbi:baeRF6 domain-containing protein [Enterococcus sp. LJL90]
MTKVGKELLAQLTSGAVAGPFVTIMLNTHVSHQDVEKDQLKFKNFAKDAKKKFLKKYPEKDWGIFQDKIDKILADSSFWRSATTSVAVVLTETEDFVYRLSIRVDDQYYVGDRAYLLAIIKNAQFNYNYKLLALTRDTMKLYDVNNKVISEVALPTGAPVDVVTALGDELTGGSINYSTASGVFHGVSTKDEEVEIDWVNYYQAVDDFLKGFLVDDKTPLFVYGLPENQAMFKKISKLSFYDPSVAITGSPVQVNTKDLAVETEKITAALKEKEVAAYNKLLDRKFIDQLVDIDQASTQGKISHLFISTSNLIDGFGEDPDTEYDRRQVLNDIAYNTISGGGEVFILDQQDAPDEKSLVAILRY